MLVTAPRLKISEIQTCVIRGWCRSAQRKSPHALVLQRGSSYLKPRHTGQNGAKRFIPFVLHKEWAQGVSVLVTAPRSLLHFPLLVRHLTSPVPSPPLPVATPSSCDSPSHCL